MVFDQDFINKIGWWSYTHFERMGGAPENMLIPKFDQYHNGVIYIEEGEEYESISKK